MAVFGMVKSGGGGVTETVLWSNNAPTTAVGQQTVTLSDAFTNYDEIRFYVRKSKTDDSYKDLYASCPTSFSTSYSTLLFSSLGPIEADSNSYSRHLILDTSSPTSVTISTAYKMNASGSNNDYVIPLKITGVKF